MTTAFRARKLDALFSVLKGHATMLIVIQDNPDPDAIASAVALRALANELGGVQCSVAYGGVVGRAENRALVKYLDLNMHILDPTELDEFDLIALVDTQPESGNNSLPAGVTPHIVMDHHPTRPATRKVGFTDIRSRYGSTSAILYEYLVQARMKLDVQLATALLYGVRSDTLDLGRESTEADVDAVLSLYPIANKRMLGKIQRGDLPRGYFKLLVRALQNACSYGRSLICGLDAVDNPDMVAEIADLLERNEDTDWVFCYGFTEDKILLSLRASQPGANAGKIIRRLVRGLGTGGGHNVSAGGQIPLPSHEPEEKKRFAALLTQRYLRIMTASEYAPLPLVSHTE